MLPLLLLTIQQVLDIKMLKTKLIRNMLNKII
jgi:hypothetical protein